MLSIAIGVTFTVIAILAYALWPNQSAYDIQPEAVLLTSGDVGPSYTQTGTGSVGPAQLSIRPLPYQQRAVAEGTLRNELHGAGIFE